MEFSRKSSHPSAGSGVAFALAVAEVTAGCHLRASIREDAVIAELPKDEEKQVYQLRRVQGMKVEAVAQLLHVSRRTVIRRTNRFIAKVRHLRLANRDGSCPACKLLTELRG
jgi:DNA-directed RNA polymerase specialized sigma24 family protein